MVSAGEGDLLEPRPGISRFLPVRWTAQTLEVATRLLMGITCTRKKTQISRREPLGRRSLERPQAARRQGQAGRYFGKVETYRHDLVIRLPYTRATASRITLKAVSQGCADVGVLLSAAKPRWLKSIFPALSRKPKRNLFPQDAGAVARMSFCRWTRHSSWRSSPIDKDTPCRPVSRSPITIICIATRSSFSLKGGGRQHSLGDLAPGGDQELTPNFGNNRGVTSIVPGDHQAESAKAATNRLFQSACRLPGMQRKKGSAIPPEQKTIALTLANG